MAYFLAANHIYVFLFVVSTAGLPVAVSILIAESIANNDEIRVAEVYRKALKIFILIGSIGSIFMLIGAKKIAAAINISGAAQSIMAISPAVLSACICGAIRGYFQGRQIMIHTAVSQVIEALGKLGLGILGAIYAVGCGYETHMVAAYAIFGITVGMMISMVYLLVAKVRYDRKYVCLHYIDKKYCGLTKRLIVTALPITLSSAVISLTSVTDTALIANRLVVAGISDDLINTLYSCYGNIAVPLFSLTPSLISPIAMSAVPIIAATVKEGGDEIERQKIILSSLKFTLFVAVPASVGLSIFSREIISLIFPSDSVVLNIATPLLSLLSLSVIGACLITVTNSILQACGKAGETTISMVSGAVVKAVAEYILVSKPSVNIFGAPLSTLACNVIVVCLNVLFLSNCMLKVKHIFYRELLTTLL
jgi:stage V sporulation protein B